MDDIRTDKPAKKYLSPKDWVDIQAGYESGEKVRDIAARYGIGYSTITKKAKRHSWAAHGSLKKEAVSEAKECVKEELKTSYRDRVKEINENHLKSFRQIKALAQKAMYLLNARLQWKIENEQRLSAEALTRGEVPPMPADVAKEVQILLDLVNINRHTIMTCERVIMGIDGEPAMEKDDEEDGFFAVAKQLEAFHNNPDFMKWLELEHEKDEANAASACGTEQQKTEERNDE